MISFFSKKFNSSFDYILKRGENNGLVISIREIVSFILGVGGIGDISG
jgi:hypothetical protein